MCVLDPGFKVELFRPGTVRTDPSEAQLDSTRQQQQQQQPALGIGDVVQLFHAETEGALCASGDLEKRVICSHRLPPEDRNSNHLFAISNPDPDARNFGAFLRPGDVFRLLNLATSQYLAVRMSEDTDETSLNTDCVTGDNGLITAYPLCLCHTGDIESVHSFFSLEATSTKTSGDIGPVRFGPFYGCTPLFVWSVGLCPL
eukprot:COSAG01_NODE_177_length_22954_cov_28.699554_14_plen_201_part_00